MQRRALTWPLLTVAGLLISSCSSAPATPRLTVAAASNLSRTFDAIAREFTMATGVEVVFSYGPTTVLAQQVENAAPFDFFAAADTAHIDRLIAAGSILPDSRAVYARGKLALWAPDRYQPDLKDLDNLNDATIRFIAIAKPDLAPYGAAARDALRNAHLWDALEPKLVFSNSIVQAQQLAETGNAEVAFTAYSLTLTQSGQTVLVDPNLYPPIDQALGVLSQSEQPELARQFAAFLLGPQGRAILERDGYGLP